MTIRSFMMAATVLSLAAATFATAAAADSTIVSFSRTYSAQELGAICGRAGGLAYQSAGGGYGCTNGTNNVECSHDGACTGFIKTPFLFTGAEADRDIEAEAVLQMPAAPASAQLTGRTASGLPPQ